MSSKHKLFFALGYIVLLAFFLEGVTRLAFSIPKIGKRLEANEDYTYRRNWVREHQKSSTATHYTFDMYDSTKGWIPKPNLKDIKVFDNKILNTNAKGLRGKQDFSYAKTKDKLRIVILGDSFTFGDEVSDDQTYPYYLQTLLPHTEVINMGVHGYGHDQMLLLFKEEGMKYHPDIVILGFLGLDMSRNLLRFRDFAKPRFVLEAGKLKLTGIPVPRPEEVLKRDWIRPRIIDLFSLIRHRGEKVLGIQQKQEEAITAAILMELIRLANSIHAIPIFAYLPRSSEIAKDIAFTEDEAFMFSLCQSNAKARCFSTRPRFAEKRARGQHFKSSGHWEPAGHLTVAEAMRHYLVDQKFFTLPGHPEASPFDDKTQNNLSSTIPQSVLSRQ